MRPAPMVLRVHDDGDLSREWLIPLPAENQPDYVFLDAEMRPSGPIQLIDPMTCEVVATASPPATGPGVRVSFNRVNLDSERWELTAQVDTLLFPPTTPLSSGTYCSEAT